MLTTKVSHGSKRRKMGHRLGALSAAVVGAYGAAHAPAAHAANNNATFTFIPGNNQSVSWGVATNWSTLAIPNTIGFGGDTATFGTAIGTNTITVTLDSLGTVSLGANATNASSLTFSNVNSTWNLDSTSTANLNSLILDNGSGAATITFSGGTGVTDSIYSKVIAASGGTGTLSITAAGASTSPLLRFGGQIQAATLNKSGTGTVDLNSFIAGTNATSNQIGTVNVSAGALRVFAQNNGSNLTVNPLANGAGLTTINLTGSGASIQLKSNTGTGNVVFFGNDVNVQLASGQNATIDVNQASTGTGTQIQIGKLTFATSAATNVLTLNVNGANSYSLGVTGVTTLASSTVINTNQNATFLNTITDGGNNLLLTKSGTGTATFSVANTLGGGVAITGGTLNANATGSLGSGTVVGNGGAVILNAVQSANNTVFLTGATSSQYNATNAAGGHTITLTNQAALLLKSGLTGVGGDTIVVGGGTGTTAGILVFQSGTQVLTQGVNLTAGAGAILSENAAGRVTSQASLQNNANLFLGASGTLTGENFTVGAGTPWQGLSTDRASQTYQNATITANNDFTLQGFASGVLTVGNGTSSGGVTINAAPAGGTVNVNILGSVSLADDSSSFSGVHFAVQSGGFLRLIGPSALGSNGNIGDAAALAGGTIAVSSTNPSSDIAVNGNLLINPGAVFQINSRTSSTTTTSAGLNGTGTITILPGSILQLSSQQGLTGTQFGATNVFAGLGVIRMDVDNIANLNQVDPNNVFEVYNTNRTETLPLIGASGMLTNDGSSRSLTNAAGLMTFQSSGSSNATLAASTGTTFTVNSAISASNLNVGSPGTIDGFAKLGTVAVNGGFTATGNITLLGGGLTLNSGGPQSVAGDLLYTNGGSVNVGSNQLLTLGGNVTVAAATNASTLAGLGTGASVGVVDLNGANKVFDVADGAPAVDLTVSAALQNGGVIKNNLGTMLLSGPNANLAGNVQVNAGTLQVGSTNALGTGTTTIASGARLEVVAGAQTVNLSNVQPLPAGSFLRLSTDVGGTAAAVLPSLTNGATLEINANVATATNNAMTAITVADGATVKGLGNFRWGATAGASATLVSVLPGTNGVTFDTAAGTTLTFDQFISGNVKLTKVGAGTLSIGRGGQGVTAYDIQAGILQIGDAGNVGAVNGTAFGSVNVGALGTLDLARNSGAVFPTFTGLSGSGTVTGSLTSPSTANGSNFQLTNATDNQFDGVFVDNGRSLAINKDGAGALRLTNANSTFTGQLQVLGGNLLVAGNAPAATNLAGVLGSSTNAVNLGNTSGTQSAGILIDGNYTIARPINVRAGSSGTVRLGANVTGTSAFTGSITLARTLLLQAPSGAAVTLGGNLTGTSGIALNSPGATFLLTGGANTFSGTTTVSAGKLLVNGVLSGSNAVQVTAAAGSLGGVGSIAGAITLTGGTLTPGDDGLPGLLTSAKTGANAVTLSAGANFAVDLAGGGGTASAGVTYDQLKAAGDVTLSGSTALTLNDTGTVASGNYFIINQTSAASPTMAHFTTVNVPTYGGATTLVDNYNSDPTQQAVLDANTSAVLYTISYAGDANTGATTGGNDVVITSVPEPVGLSLVAGVGGMALLRRRKRRGTSA